MNNALDLSTIIANVKTFFQAVFNTTDGIATQLVNWIAATPLAQVGLIMYILVAVAGVARRFIPGI